MSDYDPDVTCGICGGFDPNEEHEVHDTPCVEELNLKWHKAEALAADGLELAKVVDRERKERMYSDMKLAWEMAKEILEQAKEDRDGD